MRNFGLGKPAGGGVGARVGSDRSPYDEQKFLEIRTPLCLGDGQPPHVCDRSWLDWDLGLNEIIRALPDTRNKAIALEDRGPDEAEVFRQEFNRIRDEED